MIQCNVDYSVENSTLHSFGLKADFNDRGTWLIMRNIIQTNRKHWKNFLINAFFIKRRNFTIEIIFFQRRLFMDHICFRKVFHNRHASALLGPLKIVRFAPIILSKISTSSRNRLSNMINIRSFLLRTRMEFNALNACLYNISHTRHIYTRFT